MLRKLVNCISYSFLGLATAVVLTVAACTTPVKPGVKTFVEITYCGTPTAVYVIDNFGQTHEIDLDTKEGHDAADKLLDGVQGDSFDLCPPDRDSL